MSKNHPRHTHIFELRSGNFASVSSASGKAAVLSGNFDTVTEGHEGDGNVHGRASDDHLGVGGDGAGSVEFRDDIFKGGDGSVALPVAADEVLALEGFCVAVTSDEARRRKLKVLHVDVVGSGVVWKSWRPACNFVKGSGGGIGRDEIFRTLT